TFVDPADYEKVQELDRVSVLGLKGLAPDEPLIVKLRHDDGSEESIQVVHTLNADQITWFQAGSALNLLRDQSPA
ncbi:MAG: hypothetical protein VCC04_00740, partial [Myxococcota bacterium]